LVKEFLRKVKNQFPQSEFKFFNMTKESLLIKYRSQWPVSFEQEIYCSLPKIWEIISKPGHLEQFHPYCKKNEAIKWPGTGSQDLLTYRNGNIYKRDIVEWVDNESFSLIIGEVGKPKSFVKWEFKDNKKKIKVKITVYPHLLLNWNKFSSYLPYKYYIKPKLRIYLKAVLCGLKSYAESGVKVQRNMAARHSWFS